MGPTGPAGAPGPQGPAGPPGSGAQSEDDWGFAGFTAQTYNGAIGGRPTAHTICGAAFPNGHLCHASEFLLSNSGVQVPATGAWIELSTAFDGSTTAGAVIGFGRGNGASCTTWTSPASGGAGTYVTPEGSISVSGQCSVARSLACCNGATKATFVGFTSANATMAGRPAMHVACNAQFVGAHMCHASEYLRANSTLPIPATGAWLDLSTTHNGSTTAGASPSFGRATATSCSSWTSTASGGAGTYVTPEGGISVSGQCSVARPIACCL